METLGHNVRWHVSLSTGETFFEGKNKFQEIAGELSPWQKLQKYLAEKRAMITSLGLHTSNGQTFNLPSISKKPKLGMLQKAEKPIDFNMFRFFAREKDAVRGQNGVILSNGGQPSIADWFTVVEAIYPAHKLQIWVNELNTKSSYSVILPIGKGL